MDTLTLPPTRQSGFEKTNGFYPSESDDERVVNWVQFALQAKHDPPLSKPITVHLNTLFDRDIDRDRWIQHSFYAFQVVIEQLRKIQKSDTVMPSLYIPLECSETLIPGPIEAATLMEQIDPFEPPSIYLTSRFDRRKLRRIEQYIFPLNSTDFVGDADDIYVYYNSTRSIDDIKNGWEYGRNIVAEYYPKKYRP